MPWSDIWSGIKLHLFDAAVSAVVGLCLGFVLGFVGLKQLTTGIAVDIIFMPLGLLVSVYAAIILRRQYTHSIIAVISMGITGGLLALLTYSADGSPFTPIQTVLITISSWMAYALGWYVAGEYQFDIPLPSATLRKWLIGLGGVAVVGSLLYSLYSYFN